MSYEDRKKIFDTIHALVKPEQEEIFRIVRKLKVTYSENSNGIFFDLSTLSDDAFQQIKEYIQFCLTTRREHENRLKDLETIRIQNEQYQDTE
jgi:Bromodomain extra-terminal - transcription regulation